MPILAENEPHQARADISPATLEQAGDEWALGGSWTARELGDMPRRLDQLACGSSEVVLNGEKLAALDSAGAWLLQRWLSRQTASPVFKNWAPHLQRLMDRVAEGAADPPTAAPQKSFLERVGRSATANVEQAVALLSFVGETAAAATRQL